MKLQDGSLYFDCNATTPEAPEVAAACALAAREGFANPSSPHAAGRRALALLEEGRAGVAALVGCSPAEVVFTGSATEANHLALLSAARGRPGRRRVVLSGIEHPSVRGAAERLEEEGFHVAEAPVRPEGTVDLEALAALLDEEVAAVSVLTAHNETGVLQPVAAVGALCRATGCLFHTDAVQAAGKVASPWAEARPDYLSLAGHKLFGPKGIGALVVREGAPVTPWLRGGGQEGGRRASTEAVPLAYGFGVACRLAATRLPGAAALAALRDRFEAGSLAPRGAVIFGKEAPRLPNTSFFALPGVDGAALAAALDARGMAVGTGSACHTGSHSPPRVLQWMSAPLPPGGSSVRVSLGRTTSPADLAALAAALEEAVGSLRGAHRDGHALHP